MTRRSKVNKKEWPTADYYDILGVDESATTEAITEAYHYWIKVHHPDQHNSQPSAKKKAEENTKKLITAFTVLNDRKLRNEYDRDRNRRQTEEAGQATPSQPTPYDTYQNAPLCNVRKTIGRRCSNVGLPQYGGRCKRHAYSAHRPMLQRMRTMLALAISLPLTVLLTLGLTDVEDFLSVGESQPEENPSPVNDAPLQQPATPTETSSNMTSTSSSVVSSPEFVKNEYRDEIRERLQTLYSVSSNGDLSEHNATEIFFVALHHDLPEGRPSQVIDTWVHQARLELAARQYLGATSDWEEKATKYLKAYYLNPRIILCCLTNVESLPAYTGTHIHLYQDDTLNESLPGNLLGHESASSSDSTSPFPQTQYQLSQAISDLSVGHVLTSEDPILGPVLFLLTSISTNHSSSDDIITLTGCAFIPLHALTEGYFATYQAYASTTSSDTHVILKPAPTDSDELTDSSPVGYSGVTLAPWQCAAF